MSLKSPALGCGAQQQTRGNLEENGMKRIVMISTGGTIACVPIESGLKPELSAKELLNLVESNFEDIECVDLFSMDSSNIQPEEWITIAEAVKDRMPTCDGIVITHGTTPWRIRQACSASCSRAFPYPWC